VPILDVLVSPGGGLLCLLLLDLSKKKTIFADDDSDAMDSLVDRGQKLVSQRLVAVVGWWGCCRVK
jgi:hypothetical protein